MSITPALLPSHYTSLRGRLLHRPRGSILGGRDPNQIFLGAIDQGTTSTRFTVFDTNGVPVAQHQLEFKQMYPNPGWHEQDPYEILRSVSTCVEKGVAQFESKGYNKSQIKTVGLTTQRETVIVWDKDTGEPLHNAIAWPDTRTQSMIKQLKEEAGADKLQAICGLPISTYPSAVKLTWLLRNDQKVVDAYNAGKLRFGTPDTWLMHKLNSQEADVFVTDMTNASRTMFMDLRKGEYSQEVLDFFGLDTTKILLPKIVPSSDAEAFGEFAAGPLAGVKIQGCLGDQSAALVGQCAFEPGQAKNTYGTGCFLLYNTGEEPVISQHGLLTTVAYHFGGDRKPVYALEGSVAVAGSGVRFLMHNLGFIAASEKVGQLAATVDDSGGCVFVTAFSGLFAPYWIDDAKGTIFGITQHTQKGHIARATLEATCFQTKAILDAMTKDSGHKLAELAVDGGMSASDLCMQTQADIIHIPVDRPKMRETTSLGAAIAAAFACNIYKDFDELKNINRENRKIFRPRKSKVESKAMFKKWQKAVEMCRGWVDEEEKEAEMEKIHRETSGMSTY